MGDERLRTPRHVRAAPVTEENAAPRQGPQLRAVPGLKDAPELRGTVSSGLASGGRAGAPSSYAAFRDTRTDSPTPAFPRGRDRRETRTLQGQNPIYAGRAAPCALPHRALCSGTTARFKQQDRTHIGAPSCRWSAGPRPRTRPAPRNPVPSPATEARPLLKPTCAHNVLQRACFHIQNVHCSLSSASQRT